MQKIHLLKLFIIDFLSTEKGEYINSWILGISVCILILEQGVGYIFFTNKRIYELGKTDNNGLPQNTLSD